MDLQGHRLQGIVHARDDSPYLRRIGPALEQKNRLGTDSWGGTDRNVRAVMAPIEELFEKEFPDFAPFPWGRRAWLGLLVRNILLAEPFAFDHCVVRDALADVLRTSLGR